MILVTGATGNNGSELLQQLSATGATVRAFVRDKRQARSSLGSRLRSGVELVEGNFSRPETFMQALEGVDRLFLLMPSSPQVEDRQCAFVDAAKLSGVRHVVKLSQVGADPDSRLRFQRYHGVVEEHIRNSGLEYTFLRPNLFMQGFFNFRPSIAAQGVFHACAGTGRVSIVDVRDIVSLATLALTEPGHEGKTYDITGPESLTHEEMAEILSEVTGRTVRYVEISPNSMRHVLLNLGMSVWQADGVLEDYEAYRNGEASRIATTLEDMTGIFPMTFEEFARDYVKEFRTPAAGAA
jgi:uncharacterized protein YbjT (DUF2867 family)